MEEEGNGCQHQQEEVVLIVGARPSGLAVAASLAEQSVPSLILERDDCIASLWCKRSYERLCLHLAKQYCSLPHLPHPDTAPTYIPKSDFISYLDSYAERFHLWIRFGRRVESARYDKESGQWILKARNGDALEEYVGRYLVVAAGENDEKVVPDVDGLDSFKGVAIHSSEYRTGSAFKGKDVLLVGSGNSGMEIAYDLFEAGARTSIVVRSPPHDGLQIFHRRIRVLYCFYGCIFAAIRVAAQILKDNGPCHLIKEAGGETWRVVDLSLNKCNDHFGRFGNTAKYGLRRPDIGPLYMKSYTPIYPVVDAGAYDRIKTGEIQVLPSLTSIERNMVTFSNGKTHHFDAIIFATGYRSTIRKWLESDDSLIGDDGMAKNNYPDHWKGRNGLYSAGLIRRGIYGSSEDGLLIAKDISNDYILSKEANGVKLDEKIKRV